MLSDSTKQKLRYIEEKVSGFTHEHFIEEGALRFIKPRMIVVDGGTHFGHHLFHMADKVGAGGIAIGFEPIPSFYNNLQYKIEEANNFHPPRVKVYNAAISDKSGRTTFNWVKNMPAASGILQRDYSDTPDIEVVDVELVTLDDILAKEDNGNSRCGFIKLDLEGAEFNALKGAKNTLQLARPIVVFEFGQQSSADLYGFTKEEFFEFWNNLGYGLVDVWGKKFEIKDWGNHADFTYDFWAYPKESDFLNILESYLEQSALDLIEIEVSKGLVFNF